MRQEARGVILPVVLFVLILLGLLGAVFAFRVNADLSSTQAVAYRMQTRLAAEAGVEWAKLMLGAGRFDQSLWYDNFDAFNRIIVWARDTDATVAGTNDVLDETMVYRFSIVADDPKDDEDYIRFGLTDESSKLNLNVASAAQLAKLVSAVVGENEAIDVGVIVDAILDWRDGNSTPRGEAGDTEGEYYSRLDKPYAVKNARFDTVEELLLVKGVTAGLLYGEDFDRNGLLTDNEDDGNLSFPPDNEDRLLNRGLYPYLTVHSYENNVGNDNRQRLYLHGKEAAVREGLTELFPDDPEVVDFCVKATRKKSKNPGGSGGPGGGPGGGGDPSLPGDGAPADGGGEGSGPPGDETSSTRSTDTEIFDSDKRFVLMQVRDPGGSTDTGGRDPKGAEGSLGDGGEPSVGVEVEVVKGDGKSGQGGAQGGIEKPEGGGGTGDGGTPATPIRSPASLMLPQRIGEEIVASPLAPWHLTVLMDRTTTEPPDKRKLEGLININTAPRMVLECLEGLSGEQIDAILEARGGLDSETQSNKAWLVTEEVLDPETFDVVAPFLTARGQQFTIESLGYADHIGMVTRLQVVVDMIGPIAQTLYYRDVSYLGGGFPIREEDMEKQRGR